MEEDIIGTVRMDDVDLAEAVLEENAYCTHIYQSISASYLLHKHFSINDDIDDMISLSNRREIGGAYRC